ncbi:hypothetical protein [Mycoplasma bradburyae]|uniref:hypothetical protein n=1 Tax=Mycoplasma bradburyae TaxID=2963128 RepID=UPI002340E7FB|nr:hypothetical protein [Mycoplasma bradburyae]MDC4184186.1 hypothetical protein [Mycoplasma bradburyae]
MYNLKQTYCTINFAKEKIDFVLSTNRDQSINLLRQVSIKNQNYYDETKIINKRLLLEKIRHQIDLFNQKNKMEIKKVILNFDSLINDLKTNQINTAPISYLSADQFDNEIKKFVLNQQRTRPVNEQLVNYKVFQTIDRQSRKIADQLEVGKKYYAVILTYTSKSGLIPEIRDILKTLNVKISSISTQEINYQASQQVKDINDTIVVDMVENFTNLNIYLDGNYVITKRINLGIKQVKENLIKSLNAKNYNKDANNNRDINEIVNMYFNNDLLSLNEDNKFNLLIKTNKEFLSYQYLSKADLDILIQKQLVHIVDFINKELELVKKEFNKPIKEIIINTINNYAIANNLLNKDGELINDVDISKLYPPKLWDYKNEFMQSYLAIKRQYEHDCSINKIDNYITTPHDYNFDHESDRKAMILSINKELANIISKIAIK